MHCRKAFREKRDRQREEGSRPYVVLRIAHSLVQALINNVMIGFPLLAATSLVLLVVMTIRAALIAFQSRWIERNCRPRPSASRPSAPAAVGKCRQVVELLCRTCSSARLVLLRSTIVSMETPAPRPNNGRLNRNTRGLDQALTQSSQPNTTSPDGRELLMRACALGRVKHVGDLGLGKVRAVVPFNQQGDVTTDGDVMGPAQRLVQQRELLIEQAILLQRRDRLRSAWATVDIGCLLPPF
jgi:hypothetical protein